MESGLQRNLCRYYLSMNLLTRLQTGYLLVYFAADLYLRTAQRRGVKDDMPKERITGLVKKKKTMSRYARHTSLANITWKDPFSVDMSVK